MLQALKENRAWRKFSGNDWQREINVRDFIVANMTPYCEGPEFLAKPSERTLAVWDKLQPYFREEAKKGVLDAAGHRRRAPPQAARLTPRAR